MDDRAKTSIPILINKTYLLGGHEFVSYRSTLMINNIHDYKIGIYRLFNACTEIVGISLWNSNTTSFPSSISHDTEFSDCYVCDVLKHLMFEYEYYIRTLKQDTIHRLSLTFNIHDNNKMNYNSRSWSIHVRELWIDNRGASIMFPSFAGTGIFPETYDRDPATVVNYLTTRHDERITSGPIDFIISRYHPEIIKNVSTHLLNSLCKIVASYIVCRL